MTATTISNNKAHYGGGFWVGHAAVAKLTNVTIVGNSSDQGGGLWFADRAGRFACLGASQLTASGTVIPNIVIASPDLGSAGWFALYPAPAFTPLAHALP